MRDIEPLLRSVLSAASSALNEVETPAGLVHFAPGQTPAWDNCCEGQGQLWLRVVEAYPTAGPGAAFPAIDTTQKGPATACGVRMLAVRLALGVMRCAHTISDDGKFPTAAEMDEDTLKVMKDFSTLLEVITQVVPTLPQVLGLKVDRWTPQGVQGGCAGGEWGFYVAWDPCLGTTPAPAED